MLFYQVLVCGTYAGSANLGGFFQFPLGNVKKKKKKDYTQNSLTVWITLIVLFFSNRRSKIPMETVHSSIKLHGVEKVLTYLLKSFLSS